MNPNNSYRIFVDEICYIHCCSTVFLWIGNCISMRVDDQCLKVVTTYLTESFFAESFLSAIFSRAIDRLHTQIPFKFSRNCLYYIRDCFSKVCIDIALLRTTQWRSFLGISRMPFFTLMPDFAKSNINVSVLCLIYWIIYNTEFFLASRGSPSNYSLILPQNPEQPEMHTPILTSQVVTI